MAVPDSFLKPYDPGATEDRIYSLWEKSGFFDPDDLPERNKNGEPFSIVLPPPNVTGTLHMGHAAMLAIEDIMIRYKRMRGYRTLWLPGTDHAAIATQSKVEKEIVKKEGKNRHDLGREEFLKRVGEFAKNSHDTIVNQVRKMGASVDWSREAFTLDEKRSFAVRTAFKRMYDMGLIYRGNRIVNWDPKGQTTISDDEIVYKEEKTKFYYFKYGPFVIGTARPETKFGDKYVVMHPDDARYAAYKHGQKIDLEWINGPITATVIKDASIDMEFGTGVMTITPWHSAVDFDIAERHKLDKEQIIDTFGKLLPVAGEFAGMKIAEARPKIVEKLRAKGLVEKEEDYVHNIATAERTGGLVEPQIMKQWFVGVNTRFEIPGAKKGSSSKTLKEIMKEAVESGKIKIIPDRFEKIYYHWIDNLRDWCISRQIWYGHRVPVWYRRAEIGDERLDIRDERSETREEVYVGVEAPEGEGWRQDEDTLDTWFSSGLWTFSTLGWPEETEDLKLYHPTDVLETGYDILFFWVARMILMTGCLLGDVPFKTVYLHGLVRDGKGRKMSKSLDNIIDPLDMIKKYGGDATRLSLIIGTGPGNDLKLSEDKVRGYKNFANKLWNITRFVLESAGGEAIDKAFEGYTDADAKLRKARRAFLEEITREMEEFKFYLVGEKLYHYAWHEFADKILEDSKKIFREGDEKAQRSRRQLLLHTLDDILRALHPFMPFVTEEIWRAMDRDQGMLMVQEWPIA
ncbi:valine--tRNA ligase [Patescibacteria group bacterium]|nr:valine--tRNA ligase [Patescibacteria group bacterium]